MAAYCRMLQSIRSDLFEATVEPEQVDQHIDFATENTVFSADDIEPDIA